MDKNRTPTPLVIHKRKREPREPIVATAVNEGDYADATESYTGWCTTCKEFTRDHTEPDAELYQCPDCGGYTVIGAENALLMGHITFKEDGGE